MSDSLSPQALLFMEILQARRLEWVAMPFSRGSSQPRDQTQVCIEGEFFTIGTTRETREDWSGLSIPSPGDLPDPGVELRSPALQVDSLPSEPPRKPVIYNKKYVFGLLPIIGTELLKALKFLK